MHKIYIRTLLSLTTALLLSFNLTSQALDVIVTQSDCDSVKVAVVSRNLTDIQSIQVNFTWNNATLALNIEEKTLTGLEDPALGEGIARITWIPLGSTITSNNDTLYTVTFDLNSEISSAIPINYSYSLIRGQEFTGGDSFQGFGDECVTNNGNTNYLTATQRNIGCDTFAVDVNALNFTDIDSLLQTLSWNDPALNIIAIEEASLASIISSFDNTARTINIEWGNTSTTSFSDGMRLYSVLFEIDGTISNAAQLEESSGLVSLGAADSEATNLAAISLSEPTGFDCNNDGGNNDDSAIVVAKTRAGDECEVFVDIVARSGIQNIIAFDQRLTWSDTDLTLAEADVTMAGLPATTISVNGNTLSILLPNSTPLSFGDAGQDSILYTIKLVATAPVADGTTLAQTRGAVVYNGQTIPTDFTQNTVALTVPEGAACQEDDDTGGGNNGGTPLVVAKVSEGQTCEITVDVFARADMQSIIAFSQQLTWSDANITLDPADVTFVGLPSSTQKVVSGNTLNILLPNASPALSLGDVGQDSLLYSITFKVEGAISGAVLSQISGSVVYEGEVTPNNITQADIPLILNNSAACDVEANAPTLIAQSRPGDACEVFVDVIAVVNLQNVIAFDQALSWDNSNLSLDLESVELVGLPNGDTQINIDDNSIRLLLPNASPPISLGESGQETVLFTLKFQAIGDLGGNVTLSQTQGSVVYDRETLPATILQEDLVFSIPNSENCDENTNTNNPALLARPRNGDNCYEILVDIIASQDIQNIVAFNQRLSWNDANLNLTAEDITFIGLPPSTQKVVSGNTLNVLLPNASPAISFGDIGQDSVLYTIKFTIDGSLGNDPVLTQTQGGVVYEGDITETAIDQSDISLPFTPDTEAPSIANCPSNIMQFLPEGQSTVNVNWDYPEVSDNCGVVDTVGYEGNSGMFPIGDSTIIYIFVDEAGNSDTCTFMVQVIDLEIGITCPPDTTVSTAMSACSQTVNDIAIVGLTDMGAVQSTAYTLTGATVADSTTNGIIDASGLDFNKDTTLVTYTVTDTLGNTASCSFEVIVIDDDAPILQCPLDTIINVTINDSTAVVSNIGLVSVMDNCTDEPVVTYELSGATQGSGTDDASGEEFNLGTTTVKYFATDEEGNIDSCSFEVTVKIRLIDFECPADQVVSTASDFCGATVNNIGLVALSDTAALASMSYMLIGATSADSTAVGIIDASGLTFNKDTTTVIYTLRDTLGTAESCNFQVVVIDDVPPVIQCPNDLFINIGVDDTSANVTGTNLTSITDNCSDDFSVSYSISGATTRDSVGTSAINANGVFNRGISLVTYTVMDEDSNATMCSFNVEVETFDTLQIICPTDTIVYKVLNECEIVVNDIDVIAMPSDQIATQSFQLSGATTFTSRVDTILQASGQPFNIGTTNVTYTVVSKANEVLQCSFNVEVQDTLGIAFIDCPSDTTIFAPADSCSIIVDWMPPTLSDTCGMPVITATHEPMDTFMLGTTTVTYTVIDDLGRTDTCRFDIIIADTLQPVIMNCPMDTVLYAQDTCGVIYDWEVPMAMDNCTIDSLASNITPGSFFPIDTTQVIYRAIDASGNTRNCTFDVIVLDTIPPMLSNCPVDTMLIVGEDCMVTYTWTPPTASDNCTVELMSDFNAGDSFPVGETTVMYIATDESGNADTCSFVITVEDRTPPMIVCPEDVIVPLQSSNCDSLAVTWTDPVVSDNCEIDTVFSNFESGSLFPQGTTEVMYVVLDQSGNMDTCTFNVIVEFQETVVMNCPSDITLDNAPGSCGRNVNWTPPAFENPCSEFSVESNFQPGDFFPVGTTLVEYVVVDKAGDTTNCSFNVNILDTERPAFMNCPDDVTISVAPDECEAVHNWTSPIVTDNCSLTQLDSTHTSGSIFPVGETVVRYTASDASGNTQICEFTIRVVDNVPPSFAVCPDTIRARVDGTLLSDPSGIVTAPIVSEQCSAVTITFTEPSATDGCGTVTVTQTDGLGLSSGSAFEIGTSVLIYTATDAEGNSTNCEVVIVVEDVAPINVTADNVQPCSDTEITLTAEDLGIPNANYRWFGGGIREDGRVITINSNDINAPGVITVSVNAPTGCVLIGEITIDVQDNPEIIISHNDVLCSGEGSNLNLSGEDLNGNNIVSWMWEGPNGFSSSQKDTVIENATEANSGFYRLTAISAAGCEGRAMDTILITPSLPTPALSIVPDRLLTCEGDEINLIGQPLPDRAVSYNWSVMPDTGTVDFIIDTLNTNVAKAIFNQSGQFTFQYWITENGCTSDTISREVSVGQVPIVDASFIGNTECIQPDSTIQLFETGGEATNWLWTGPNGFVDTVQNPILTNINSMSSGIYQVEADIDGCAATAEVQLDFSGSVPMPSIVPLDLVCSKDSIPLTIEGMYNEEVQFTWNIPSLLDTLLTTNSNVLTIVPDSTGTFTATVFASDGACVSMMDTITFTTATSPVVDLSTITTEYLCIAQDSTIQLNETGGQGAKWEWTGPDDFSSGLPNPTFVVNNETATQKTGRYFVTVLGDNGCELTDFVDIEFFEGITPLTIEGGSRFCLGETITLTANGAVPDTAEYSWIGPNEFKAGGKSITLEAQLLQEGEYIVVASAGGCTSTPSDSFSVQVVSNPVVEPDQYEVIINEEQILDVLANDNLLDDVPKTFGLTRAPFLGSAEITGAGLTYVSDKIGMDNLNYEICYEGCQDPTLRLCEEGTANIRVKYPDDLCVITNVITPNGDGKNDFLVISCVEGEVYPNNELIVFNQWGDEVYRANPYQNDWGGTYNGANLPDGTYFYVFKPSSSAETLTGYVTIYR